MSDSNSYIKKDFNSGRISNTECCVYLDEANFLGIAAEALSATHESILSNNCMRITTHTAAIRIRNSRSTT